MGCSFFTCQRRICHRCSCEIFVLCHRRFHRRLLIWTVRCDHLRISPCHGKNGWETKCSRFLVIGSDIVIQKRVSHQCQMGRVQCGGKSEARDRGREWSASGSGRQGGVAFQDPARGPKVRSVPAYLVSLCRSIDWLIDWLRADFRRIPYLINWLTGNENRCMSIRWHFPCLCFR